MAHAFSRRYHIFQTSPVPQSPDTFPCLGGLGGGATWRAKDRCLRHHSWEGKQLNKDASVSSVGELTGSVCNVR